MMSQRIPDAAWMLLATALLTGCVRPVQPSPKPPQSNTTGRLVPAVISGFERGFGSWQVSTRPVVSTALTIQDEGASRGSKWLSVRRTGANNGAVTVNLYVDVPVQDWSRFGSTVRADVRCTVPSDAITARLFLSDSDDRETESPAATVGTNWKTVSWNAGDSLKKMKRLGVRYQMPELYYGRVGLDNVRLGAENALHTAWSIAVGPFASRELAQASAGRLDASGVDSFPLYYEGWFLNVGTFSSEKAAGTEAERLSGLGIKTVILER